MTETIDALQIERPVLNYDQTDWAYLQAEAHKAPDFDGQPVPNIFLVFESLAAVIISQYELRRLHRHLGIQPDREELQDLGSRVVAATDPTGRERLDAETLPAELLTSKSRGRNRYHGALVVAGHPLIGQEKGLARQAVQAYYELDEVPDNIWRSNHHQGVQIARSGTSPTRRVIEHMEVAISSGGGLLPANTVLDRVTSQDLRMEVSSRPKR